MATRGKSICCHAGCSKVVDTPGRCARHAKQVQQQADADRGTAYERGYTSAWVKARAHYLRAHPQCVYCMKRGWAAAATVVDHIIPHRLKDARDSGDEAWITRALALFWDSKNWQSLCKPHHDIDKHREEAADRKRQDQGG
jgi:5-methylcytosine-specific restriction enzyme A